VRDGRRQANRNHSRAPGQGRGRLSLSAPADAYARDRARREAAAARRQTFFELRSRAAEPADAGRGRRYCGNRGRRGGVEEKAAVPIAAATANFFGPADFAAATGGQAARAEARD